MFVRNQLQRGRRAELLPTVLWSQSDVIANDTNFPLVLDVDEAETSEDNLLFITLLKLY